MLAQVVPRESISYLGHATVRADLAGARLLTDPVLRDRLGHLRRWAPPVARDAYERLDGVLLSHLHRDHLDAASLRRLPRDVPIVVPRGGGRLVRRHGFARVHEVGVGETVEVARATVTAVPAEHSGRRRPFLGGAQAEAVGFVVAGGARLYFAGDTDRYPEMALLGPLDVALLPVWGWGPSVGSGHMAPEAAAHALTLLRPRIAVPIHWGTLFPVGLARFHRDRLSQPPREFARHAARVAPDVRVEILEPGATLELHGAPA
jgi:L-ascorbate metabolism protein UlaG (beta-lactamase superfamily)